MGINNFMEDQTVVPTALAQKNPQISLIAGQIADTDSLIVKNHELSCEIVRLKTKLISLKQSAVLVKQLYNEKCEENQQLNASVTSLCEKLKESHEKYIALENTKINSDLSHQQESAQWRSCCSESCSSRSKLHSSSQLSSEGSKNKGADCRNNKSNDGLKQNKPPEKRISAETQTCFEELPSQKKVLRSIETQTHPEVKFTSCKATNTREKPRQTEKKIASTETQTSFKKESASTQTSDIEDSEEMSKRVRRILRKVNIQLPRMVEPISNDEEVYNNHGSLKRKMPQKISIPKSAPIVQKESPGFINVQTEDEPKLKRQRTLSGKIAGDKNTTELKVPESSRDVIKPVSRLEQPVAVGKESNVILASQPELKRQRTFPQKITGSKNSVELKQANPESKPAPNLEEQKVVQEASSKNVDILGPLDILVGEKEDWTGLSPLSPVPEMCSGEPRDIPVDNAMLKLKKGRKREFFFPYLKKMTIELTAPPSTFDSVIQSIESGDWNLNPADYTQLVSWSDLQKVALLNEIERRVFTFGNFLTKQLRLFELRNLATFFVFLNFEMRATCKSRCRLFIYKCFYYYTSTAFSLVQAVLSLHPRSITADPDDILAIVFRFIIKSKGDMLTFFPHLSRCKVWSQDEITAEFLSRLQFCQFKNLSHSIILLCKRNGFQWAIESLVKPHFFPLLMKNQASNDLSPTDEQQTVFCLLATSAILKTSSLNTDIKSFHHVLSVMMLKGSNHNIQEAAARSLLRLTRFGIIDIYVILRQWKPLQSLSKVTKAAIRSFLLKKPNGYWVQLNKSL